MIIQILEAQELWYKESAMTTYPFERQDSEKVARQISKMLPAVE